MVDKPAESPVRRAGLSVVCGTPVIPTRRRTKSTSARMKVMYLCPRVTNPRTLILMKRLGNDVYGSRRSTWTMSVPKLVSPPPNELNVAGEIDAAEVDREIISRRLVEDVAASKGKVYKLVAGKLSVQSIGRDIHHKNPVTCVAQFRSSVYTGSKNGVIDKWDVSNMNKPVRTHHINRVKKKTLFAGHLDDVLSMAISGDGKFLATGGGDKRICIWNTSEMTHLKTFTQHRGAIMVPSPITKG
jgi:WD40 repeat protein